MSRQSDEKRKALEKKIRECEYIFCHYKKFNYELLRYINTIITAGQGRRLSYNDVIIMADTETSKKCPDELIQKNGKYTYKTEQNHVVAWTISIRAFHHNICTLWGHKPSKMIETITRIHEHMSGERTVIYFHNFAYDHIFMRKFAYDLWGKPLRQLNVKSHYPIYIEYENGIIFKDSLILAQRSLDKWSRDLDVEHGKAVGLWDYDKLRNQSDPLTDDEKTYIEHDTLAGVECIDKTIQALNKKIYSVPLTATGIPREQTRKRGKKKAHDEFFKMALTYEQYIKFTKIYHGGYTHGNRHFVNTKICKETLLRDVIVKCFDFSSSYPFVLLSTRFPMEKYTKTENCSADFIINNMEEYSYAFRFIATNIRIKSDDESMPALQFSKCEKVINPILDNGRILAANYVEIMLCEYDLKVIRDQYIWDGHICCEVEFAAKDYLPRWFTDYVYECYEAKTMLKKSGDPVAYSIAKSRANSLYGMIVMKAIRENIVEDYETGEFNVEPQTDPKEEYEKYVNKITSIFPYQWGAIVTSAAFANLHTLIKCCRLPLYGDTDSCYGIDWDMDAVERYNQECKEKLLANGYGAVKCDGREYWLGIAEHDGEADEYYEFKFMGAKRYCGRCVADDELHLTVAGVPKNPGAKCLKSIDDFAPGFIFSGVKTGKKTHVYFNVPEIYIDKYGNETGDSISLIPCDYELDAVEVVDWESIFDEEVEIQIYDEN